MNPAVQQQPGGGAPQLPNQPVPQHELAGPIHPTPYLIKPMWARDVVKRLGYNERTKQTEVMKEKEVSLVFPYSSFREPRVYLTLRHANENFSEKGIQDYAEGPPFRISQSKTSAWIRWGRHWRAECTFDRETPVVDLRFTTLSSSNFNRGYSQLARRWKLVAETDAGNYHMPIQVLHTVRQVAKRLFENGTEPVEAVGTENTEQELRQLILQKFEEIVQAVQATNEAVGQVDDLVGRLLAANDRVEKKIAQLTREEQTRQQGQGWGYQGGQQQQRVSQPNLQCLETIPEVPEPVVVAQVPDNTTG